MVVTVTGRAGYTSDDQHDQISSSRVFAILILCEAGDGGGGEADVAGHGRDDVRGGGRPLQPRLQCKSFLLSTILLLVTAKQSLLSSIYSLIIFTHRTQRIQR